MVITNMDVRTRMGTDPKTVRKVFQRDRGVCQQCGTDMELIQHLYNLLCTVGAVGRDQVLNYWKVSPARDFGRWWTIDHIRPLNAEGDSQMVNLQTLCGPCHGEKEKLDLTSMVWIGGPDGGSVEEVVGG